MASLTLPQAKVELEKLIACNEVQYNSGIIGCCKNYFVTFPNDSQKYKYNINKLISNKLRNKISSHLYTMSSNVKNKIPVIINDITSPDDDDGRPKNLTKRQRIERRKSVKTIQRAVRQRQRRKNDAVGKIIGAFNKRIKLLQAETNKHNIHIRHIYTKSKKYLKQNPSPPCRLTRICKSCRPCRHASEAKIRPQIAL